MAGTRAREIFVSWLPIGTKSGGCRFNRDTVQSSKLWPAPGPQVSMPPTRDHSRDPSQSNAGGPVREPTESLSVSSDEANQMLAPLSVTEAPHGTREQAPRQTRLESPSAKSRTEPPEPRRRAGHSRPFADIAEHGADR